MKKYAIAIAGGAALMTTMFVGPTARADTFDPHMPNSVQGYCPGGGWGGFSGDGYCDGVHYPDGSYWHQLRWVVPFVGSTLNLQCVVDDGSLIPPPAPPGGCNGAV